ncbi:MAG: nucleotidyl transferase AbiEii/AbiGii toxin family protein [Gammaproteobacteria bacterium]|nr:nucleotidyl transferase AbiEii/AbiGii toxin family protein [Gammaproteobacteria bacterium]
MSKEGHLLKLLIHDEKTVVKIEPNFIVRGILLPMQLGSTCARIKNEFGSFIDEIPIMASDELYAGKICAALSRQHPRDLFDIKLLLETTGVTDSIRQMFLVYLVCNSRPIHEILSPNLIDIKQVFEKEFFRMTRENVFLEELLLARQQLIKEISKKLTEQEKKFLLSIKSGKPEYDLLPYSEIHKLPALQWKLMNLKKLNEEKHQQLIQKLKMVLN